MNNNYSWSEMNHKNFLARTFIARNFWDGKILQLWYYVLLNVGAECHTWFMAQRMWSSCRYGMRLSRVLYQQWDHDPEYHKSHTALHANIKWFEVFFLGAMRCLVLFGTAPFNIIIMKTVQYVWYWVLWQLHHLWNWQSLNVPTQNTLNVSKL